MPVSLTLGLVSSVALGIQLLIFVYLYRWHRVRFFRYIVWAWGCFVLWKVLSLVRQVAPDAAVVGGVMNASGTIGDLLILAAGYAFRNDYRIRWLHAALGGAYALVAAVFGHASVIGVGVPTSEGIVTGGAIVVGGLAFWPRGAVAAPRGARFLAAALALWGLHRVVTPFVIAPAGSAAFVVVNASFVLFYFLTVFAIIIVVLDRARVEAASLKEFNERLVDGLGEGLQLVDPGFTVRHANRWVEARFGAVIGRPCYKPLTADGQPCPGCPMSECATLTAPVRLEVVGADDRRFSLTCSPVRQPDGQTFLLELVAEDTEQERLRSRLAEAERLAALGELAAGVAHEIRNPLAAIVNATTLLEQEPALTAEERTATLAAVKKEARRLNATLSDFLSFARPRQPNREYGSIGEIVTHVAALVRETRGGEAGSIEVAVQVGPDVPRFAFDHDQLTQVLWNIALNGVEAMDGRGRLRLEVGRRDGDVMVAVTDSGRGIPPEERTRIFQPFYSRKPGGTGLGLAIAKRIVTAHGGRIDVDSAPGQGSRFTIRLPAAER